MSYLMSSGIALRIVVIALCVLIVSSCSDSSADPEAWSEQYAHLKPVKKVYPGAFVLEGEINQDMLDRLDAFQGTEAVYRSAATEEGGFLPSDFDMQSKLIDRLAKLDRVIFDDFCAGNCAEYFFLVLDNAYVNEDAVITFHSFRWVRANILKQTNLLSESDFNKLVMPLALAERDFFKRYDVDLRLIAQIDSMTRHICIPGVFILDDLGEKNETHATAYMIKDYTYWTTDSQGLKVINPNATVHANYDSVDIREKQKVHRRSGVPTKYTTNFSLDKDYPLNSRPLPVCEERG